MQSASSSGRGAAVFMAFALIAIGVVMNLLGADVGPSGPTEAQVAAREATGGASTLEDILARQRGEAVSNDFRREQQGAPTPDGAYRAQLGTLGGASDADLWRALRFDDANINVSTTRDIDKVLVQDGGMPWLQFREGPLTTYGMGAIGAMLVLLALFYAVRGPIRIDSGRSGMVIPRFNDVERFAHWLLAVSFIVLAVTGIALLIGRQFLIPLMGKEAFATMAQGGKWVHNNLSWAFMLALVMIFLLWVAQNIPNRHDLKWLAMGGGFFGGGHPPSRKFNAGQKLIFWSVVVLGGSISASGLSLLFPFEMPMFAPTFEKINAAGAFVGLNLGLPTELAPHQEMQLAQAWHAIVSFVLITIIVAHIYIGSVGMEGGFEAMGSGKVDANWAKEHHNLWVKELEEKGRAPSPGAAAQPAE